MGTRKAVAHKVRRYGNLRPSQTSCDATEPSPSPRLAVVAAGFIPAGLWFRSGGACPRRLFPVGVHPRRRFMGTRTAVAHKVRRYGNLRPSQTSCDATEPSPSPRLAVVAAGFIPAGLWFRSGGACPRRPCRLPSTKTPKGRRTQGPTLRNPRKAVAGKLATLRRWVGGLGGELVRPLERTGKGGPVGESLDELNGAIEIGAVAGGYE